MDKEPLISIIIPVYNVEKYLAQCLDSLIGQTYKNIEIICVNDSSEDSSLKILLEFAEKDERIKIIDKANEGVSKARNAGMKEATGKYIMFADSDDWIDACTCRVMADAAERYNADVVMCSYVSETDRRSEAKNIFLDERVFEKDEVKEKLHRRYIGLLGSELACPEKADSLSTVCGKLYLRDIIFEHKTEFIDLDEIGTYEDGMFNLEVFNYVEKAVYLPQHFYHYRRNNVSSQTSKFRPNLSLQWQNLFDKMSEYIKENNFPKEYTDALDNRIALSVLGLGINITSAPYTHFKKTALLKEIICSERYRQALKKLEFKYFPIHWKVFYGCAKFRCAFGLYLLLCAIKRIIR